MVVDLWTCGLLLAGMCLGKVEAMMRCRASRTALHFNFWTFACPKNKTACFLPPILVLPLPVL